MTLEKNKDIARSFIQVWGMGKLDIIDELASSELSVYYPAFHKVIKGIAAFKQQITRFRSGFGDADIQIEEEIAEGDKDRYFVGSSLDGNVNVRAKSSRWRCYTCLLKPL